MTKLGDLYTDFSRIDLDTRGGYARVAQVKTNGQAGIPELCAFKLMRHELKFHEGIKRFEDEMGLLVKITNDNNAPTAITRIYDSGFVPVELSKSLQKRETPNPALEITQTGTDIKKFIEVKASLEKSEPDRWLPYLLVELAPYDDSLLRQIHQQPADDPAGIYRLPTGEVIAMAIQLLEVLDYVHTVLRRAYVDWKPEHIFWSGIDNRVKLIDWNVTIPLNDDLGEKQNIRDDLRLFCGAALYIGLTFVDPDDPSKPIGPRPTTDIQSPVPQIRRRYWTDNPEFYQRDSSLSDEIKNIIRQGLDPKKGFASTKELKNALLAYAQKELGLSEDELTRRSEPISPYFKALTEVRVAQKQFLQAQQHLIEAIGSNGRKLEFTRLFDAIKRALMNFPVS